MTKNVVAFGVEEGEREGKWYGRVPGAVRPKLQWSSGVLPADIHFDVGPGIR